MPDRSQLRRNTIAVQWEFSHTTLHLTLQTATQLIQNTETLY